MKKPKRYRGVKPIVLPGDRLCGHPEHEKTCKGCHAAYHRAWTRANRARRRFHWAKHDATRPSGGKRERLRRAAS